MIRRHAEDGLRAALSDTPVVLVHGPRQCGKSTLADRVSVSLGGFRRVSLDDPVALGLAKRDPKAFLQMHKAPLLIDEVQRAPELFLPIKLAVDVDRRPGRYLLTGSANALMLPQIADSLAGRMEVIDLWPLTQAEIEGVEAGQVSRWFDAEEPGGAAAEPIERLAERLVRGGFPEPVQRPQPARRQAWFSAYERTLLERDVRELANIEALAQMPVVLRLLAARSGQTLNSSAIAGESRIPYTSFKRYLGLLEALFLVAPIPAWSRDKEAALAKSPRLFMVDSGVLCHADRLDASRLASDLPRLESLLRSFVGMELLRLASVDPLHPSVHHLRTIRRLEVDFVLEATDGRIVGIQVRAGTAQASDADGLRYLRELAGDRFVRGLVLDMGLGPVPLDRDIVSVPIATLWS